MTTQPQDTPDPSHTPPDDLAAPPDDLRSTPNAPSPTTGHSHAATPSPSHLATPPDDPTTPPDDPTTPPNHLRSTPNTPSPAAAHPHTATPSPHPTTAPLRWLLRLHRPALASWLALVLLLAALQLAGWIPFVDGALRTARYGEGAILRHDDLFGYATTALFALPLVVGAWSGAALFGRDLESGTARLTWSQGVTPARWLGGGLLASAVLLTVGTGLLVVLHRLTWQAGDSESVHMGQWYEDDTLFTNGPAAVALVLAGLAGGALAALLCRRTLPALAVGAGIALVVREVTVRVTPYLWPTVTDTTGLHAGYRSSGLEVAAGVVTSSGAHVADPGCGPVLPEDGGASCQAVYDKVDGAGLYVTYHPESHFWPLQFAATGFVLAVAGLLALAAFLVLRRTYGPARSSAPANTGPGAVRSAALKEVTV
ncbi:hypothetical protein [Streptomyces acidiscabies]|uniref:hypothetical protein n=1 Tax=Streptomyces acidiscabies TaxID=42234 RepID=UPI00073F8B25|nr:hypothetical protein [Streptomyces acidiscabies]GAQ57727.1 hypothetical protein a10_07599 [Streptomyces acidiscabies]